LRTAPQTLSLRQDRQINFPVSYADKTTATPSMALAGKGIADDSKVLVSPAGGRFDVVVIKRRGPESCLRSGCEGLENA